MEIEQLQKWLRQLNEIPKIKKKKETFLNISGLPHYENVWSNIYAFFFNTQGRHGLKELFINSLTEILNEKRHPFVLNEYDIYREFGTQKEGRIDLLLSNENSAIIIEAKVNHSVNNDFNDYWNSVKATNKIGVLLTLKEHSHIKIGSDDVFINITHKELIGKVISKLPEYYLDANPIHQIFLQDFCQTIYNITNPMDTQVLEFYYQNRIRINQLSSLRNEVKDYIIDQFENGDLVKRIRYDLNLYKKQNEKRYVYYKFKENENIMLTILYDRLWNWNEHGCRVDIYLELQGNTLKTLKDRNEEFIKTLTEEEKQALTNYKFDKNGYEHYAHLRININPDDIKELINIQEIVTSQIKKSQLLNIADKIIRYKFK